MKRIIAFVLFALMIYAGGYFAAFGLNELTVASSYPVSLDNVGSDTLHNKDMVSGTVYQQVKCLGTETVRQEVFGIEYGKPIEQRFYLVPYKYEKKAENTKYYVVCLSNPESIEQMENLGVLMPKPESGDGVEVNGIVFEITPEMRTKAYGALVSNPELVGADGFLRNPTRTYYENHILSWTVYERTSFDLAWITFIIGIALLLGGIIPTVILGIKIYRERH